MGVGKQKMRFISFEIDNAFIIAILIKENLLSAMHLSIHCFVLTEKS